MSECEALTEHFHAAGAAQQLQAVLIQHPWHSYQVTLDL